MKKKTFFILQVFIFILTGVGVWGYSYYREYKDLGHVLDASHVEDTNSSVAKTGLGNDFYTFKVDLQQISAKKPASKASIAIGSNGGSTTEYTHTQQSIYSLYVPAFEQLQKDIEHRIDQLAIAAIADYKTGKRTGTPTVPELISKYTTAGQKLQAGADHAFYTLLDQMKADLQSAGLPLDLVYLAQQEYEARMQLKKGEMISKAKSHF